MKLIYLLLSIFLISGCFGSCKPEIKIVTKYISVDKDIDKICSLPVEPKYEIFNEFDDQNEFDRKTVINLTLTEEYLKLYHKYIKCVRRVVKSSGESFETNSN